VAEVVKREADVTKREADVAKREAAEMSKRGAEVVKGETDGEKEVEVANERAGGSRKRSLKLFNLKWL
jgi:hypothetical protein